jgi:hypothetical protein
VVDPHAACCRHSQGVTSFHKLHWNRSFAPFIACTCVAACRAPMQLFKSTAVDSQVHGNLEACVSVHLIGDLKDVRQPRLRVCPRMVCVTERQSGPRRTHNPAVPSSTKRRKSNKIANLTLSAHALPTPGDSRAHPRGICSGLRRGLVHGGHPCMHGGGAVSPTCRLRSDATPSQCRCRILRWCPLFLCRTGRVAC